ncbi:hypothetical protein BDV24DRAFT_126498 [Aspergillus arachidicola]|uniref:Uncharacterized protein n=1 Tax=Aspergillus arachidicola TaxID=656916 RepID=A0A5N6YHD2_9EURO|nr:hypothetical protein BDV24DRAFT_126498 [Aspergillus arachidicola]
MNNLTSKRRLTQETTLRQKALTAASFQLEPVKGGSLRLRKNCLPATSRSGDGEMDLPHSRGRINETRRDEDDSVDWGAIHGVLSRTRLLGTTQPIATYCQCDRMYPVLVKPERERVTEVIPPSLLSEMDGLIASSKAMSRSVKNY